MKTTTDSRTNLIAQLDRDISATERHVKDDEQWLKSLHSARDKLAGNVAKRTAKVLQISQGTRTSLLKTILTESEQPLSMNDIMRELRNRGRNDDRKLVASTMGYLHRTNFASRRGDGTWEVVTDVALVAAA